MNQHEHCDGFFTFTARLIRRRRYIYCAVVNFLNAEYYCSAINSAEYVFVEAIGVIWRNEFVLLVELL